MGHANFVNAPALDIEYLDRQAIDLHAFAHSRHAPEAVEEVPPDGLEPVALDLHVQAILDLVDVHFAVEDESPAPFVDDRLRLDVVLVADLADDLLEEILDRHEPSRAAVFVHHDRHLRLLTLKLLQELRHALALRYDGRRPHKWGDRLRVIQSARVITRHQIFHEDEPGDVVEAVLEHREPRILLLAKQRAQLA